MNDGSTNRSPREMPTRQWTMDRPINRWLKWNCLFFESNQQQQQPSFFFFSQHSTTRENRIIYISLKHKQHTTPRRATTQSFIHPQMYFFAHRFLKDRADGGRQLARKMAQYKDRPDAIVIGLPRGGIVTGIHRSMCFVNIHWYIRGWKATLLQKSCIFHLTWLWPERSAVLAMKSLLLALLHRYVLCGMVLLGLANTCARAWLGWVCDVLIKDGSLELDHETLNMLRLTQKDLQHTIDKEKVEAKRRIHLYRGNRYKQHTHSFNPTNNTHVALNEVCINNVLQASSGLGRQSGDSSGRRYSNRGHL